MEVYWIVLLAILAALILYVVYYRYRHRASPKKSTAYSAEQPACLMSLNAFMSSAGRGGE